MSARPGVDEERRALKSLAIGAARDATREFRAVLDSIEQRLEALEDCHEEQRGLVLLALSARAQDAQEPE